MFDVRYHPELAQPDLIEQLRAQVWYDQEGLSSLFLVEDRPLPPYLERIARAVCPERPPSDFRAVILRGYRDGRAGTPCHSDRGATGFCFILSLGATRTFRMHPTFVRCEDKVGDFIPCPSGTAVLMDEAFHDSNHHQLAPDEGVTDERLSLVFRTRPTAQKRA